MTNYGRMPNEDHWSSPVATDLVGQWLSLREVVEKEPDQVPFTDLSLEKKSELVAERIRLRPQFEMSAIGKEIIDKERAIKEVKRRTSLGHTLIEIEQRMIRMLLESARAGKLWYTEYKQSLNIKRRVELRLDLKILAIDSSYDKITKGSCEYRNRHVYPYLKLKGFEIVRCQDQSARRSYVKSELAQDDIVYITGVGHGTDTVYMGEDSNPIFDIGKYQPKELNNKIVHLFACQTAAKLGPDFVKHGCLAFFGYDVEHIVYMHISDAFFDCDSEIDRAFADGLTSEEVYVRVIEYYNRKISELKDGGHYKEAAALEHNRDHLCAPSVDSKWGDKNARLR